MNSIVHIRKYNYVYKKGYPIIISHAYKSSKGVHNAEIYLIEANYNKPSKKVILRTYRIDQLLNITLKMDIALDIINNEIVSEYQAKLSNIGNELIDKSIPLQVIDPDLKVYSINLIKNAKEIIEFIKKKTKSPQLKEYLNIDAITLEYESL